ncbi:MAG: class I SAM-dependent methyltransferase [Pseudomonadota bacterium]
MSTKPSADPWGDFWAINKRSRVVGGGNGCLPQRWGAIERALQGAWERFVQSVSEGGTVLDLATGDGRIMGWMQEKRSDLSFIGIDLSPSLPPPPRGTRSRSGIPMEAVPFDDGSMAAVVSQFGFEYGDVAKVAKEIARVLAPGGRVGLIMHRGDGPILEHNKARRAQLMWALKDKGTARKVRNILADGPAAIDKAASFAERVASQGAKRFGETSPAWEIPEAIKRTCLMGRSSGVASIIETIGTIESHAKNELGRINSLAGACATADRRDAIIAEFGKHGLECAQQYELSEPSGRAFADFAQFK